MSVLRVDTITNLDNDGAPEFSQGFNIPDGKTITGDVNLSGVATATVFSGNGSGITVVGGIPNATIFALTFIT